MLSIQPVRNVANPLTVVEPVRLDFLRVKDQSLVNQVAQANAKPLPSVNELIGRGLDIVG